MTLGMFAILAVTYLICGLLTAVIAIIEKWRSGEFNPYNATEDDAVVISRIMFLFPIYIFQRLMERKER